MIKERESINESFTVEDLERIINTLLVRLHDDKAEMELLRDRADMILVRMNTMHTRIRAIAHDIGITVEGL